MPLPRSTFSPPVLLAAALLAALTLGMAPSARSAVVVSITGIAGTAAASSRDADDSPRALDRTAASGCGEGMLPDGDGCVRLPRDGDDEGALDAPAAENAHRERSGRWAIYDQIPRRPDRTADYDAYRYPTPPGLAGGRSVISGYDLDRPDPLQRRGATIRAIGHGGVDLPQVKGTPIKLVSLEHQRGPAQVIYVGPLFGTTVVTRHSLVEAGQIRDYLLLFGHLDAAAPGVAMGVELADGDLVGFVGDTGSPELVHLHLEARRVREGVDPSKLGGAPWRLLASDISIVCDPRNVLPLR